MKHIITLLLITLAPLAVADTFADRLNQMAAGVNVIGVRTASEPAPVSGWNALWTARVEYVTTSDGVAQQNTVALVGIDHGGQNEAWYWARQLPEPLRPTAADDRFFTGRTTPFTAAQVESYCQAKWAALHSPTPVGPIIQFGVSAVDSRSVQVTGLFDVSGSRERRTYLIWLVDVNGTVTPGSTNVKFELIKEATAGI